METLKDSPSIAPRSIPEAPSRTAGTVKAPVSKRSINGGHVVRCDGEYALVSANVQETLGDQDNPWRVGQIFTIFVGENRVVGIVCGIETVGGKWRAGLDNQLEITLELLGEIAPENRSGGQFTSGIANYPQVGCVTERISDDDLRTIYRSEGDSVVRIGNLTQASEVEAKIDIERLLSRHFAIVGSTGVGKSTSVTLMMRKIVSKRPDLRIIMLDPHNEFATAFPGTAHVINSDTLQLPFWLFKLDEFAEVVFRGQPGFDAEAEILRDLIPQAKEICRTEGKGRASATARKSIRTNITADMPLPYRLQDLLALIDERLGLLDNKAEKPTLKSLKQKLETITKDSRFSFMFECGVNGDIMENVISEIFRVPHNGKPICVLEMSGLPTEVVNSVVSVLCRIAFELGLNSNGGIQTLVVCEEAHRYIPADEKSGFWPTRQSISRIAKEGRKYGVYLSIITQRPSELDSTILSQCNTIFAMRLGNERDQEIIRGAVTNGAKSTIGFLSSIANQECIAFGEALPTPMRMTFETLSDGDLPGARIYENQKLVKEGREVALSPVLRRMRMEAGISMPGVSDAEKDASLKSLAEVGQQAPSRPGDEINSILNAAYPGAQSANNSLQPSAQQTRSQMHTAQAVSPEGHVGRESSAGSGVVNNLRDAMFRRGK